MPGKGVLIEGAMQQAAQLGRQIMRNIWRRSNLKRAIVIPPQELPLDW
jgi:hypothetical protein